MNEDVNRFLLSLINVEDWNAAKWKATGFVVTVGSQTPPSLVVVFTHEDPAREVFAGLRAKVGQDDEEELLRVCIIEGTFYDNQPSYTVSIGPDIGNVMKHFNVDVSEKDEDFVALARVNRMKAPSQLLGSFKESYRKTGTYFLMPSYFHAGSFVPIDGLRIKKRSIIFRRKEDIVPGGEDSFLL
jgi:hypothetical protein